MSAIHGHPNPSQTHHFLRPISLFIASALLALVVQPAAYGDEHDIIRVEEDWELAVAAPDAEADVPQVVCVFGPADPDTDTHAVFELNHSSLPSFSDGGLQLQCWYYDRVLAYRNSDHNGEMEASVDYVTYTTVTELHDDHMHLEIVNGNSITWGEFGGGHNLRILLYTWRNNLNNYNADHSIEHSRVAFGANRVNRFVRREVRFYTATGLHHKIEEDTYVHQLMVDNPDEGPDTE